MIDPSSSEESDVTDDPGDLGARSLPDAQGGIPIASGGGTGVMTYQVPYQGSALGGVSSSFGSGIWSQGSLGTSPGTSGAEQRSMSLTATGGGGSSDSCSPGGYLSRSNSVRPSSPSPSLASDKDKEDSEKSEKEEEERRKRLQLYVFVMRCIAYPFNAKQPTDMARRQAKITRQQLQTLKERFQVGLSAFLDLTNIEK